MDLCVIHSEVVTLVDKGFVVDMIFLDFSKVFDAVNPSIILTKLQLLGIGGKFISWIREFLHGQTMCVKVAGKLSNLRNVTSGVFHSVLFMIYINYTANSVDCCYKVFAHNFKMYLSFPQNTGVPILQRMMQLQRDLDTVCSVARS